MIYGIGTDLVEIKRIEDSLHRHGDKFAQRILNAAEITEYAQSAQPARFLAKRFAAKEAFSKAGIGYFNPHSFRKTLALLGGTRCKTPEEYKAWSQNLGHENVLTTFSSYGAVNSHRQAELIRSLV